MRFLSIFFFVVMCGVIDEVNSMMIRYVAKQKTTKIYKEDIVSAKTPVTEGQPVTWHKSFDQGELYFGGIVRYKDEEEDLDWSDICVKLIDGSSTHLAGEILRKTWIPDGSCPVKEGTFKTTNPTDPDYVDLTDPAPKYSFFLDVGYSEDDLIFSTEYLVQRVG
ncbi:uncharacterized protein [Venturia canescens]|uniref:uncharacterized protein n=1 Tax=Venturia canescens TaxID=32260 RepID=UPI001C9D0971|nr:uncharacterized protein LOC122416862 [Venturia canescens]